MHTNLFGYGHSRREVREALKQHQKRDNGVLKVLDFVTLASVIYLTRHWPNLDMAAAIAGVLSATSALRYFIDQSNRNFYLHRLDWEDAGPDPE